MSGLTNTTGFSFLGLTNLTQGNYDNLFVNILTANTGTITLLNSTTGNITTLNTTTANITTLLTDLWRGSTASSSMVIGVSGDSGTLTSWRNLIMEANKTITLNATGGEILSPKYNSTSSTQALTIGGTNTTSEIRIGGALTSGILELGTIGVMTSGIICNGDLSIGTTANNKGIACNFFTGLQATDLIRFLQSTTTGNLRICENQTSGGITIGHLTPASDSGTLTINKNTTLGAGKNLTINSVNKIICNTFEGTTATDSINLFTTTTGSPIFPTISLGNTTNSGAFIINPNTTMNNNLTLASSKTITLNATGGKVLCNVYTGTATSSNLTIGESGDTGNLSIFKTIVSSNTYSGTNTFSGGNTHSGSNTFSGATNTFNNTILGNTIQGTTGASSISLYGTTTASVNFATTLIDNALTIGNPFFVAGISTGSVVINLPLTCNQNITLASSRKVLSNVYTGTTTSSNLTIGESGDTGTLTIFKTTNIPSSSMSGTLSVNNIQGTTTSSAITLFTLSSVSSPTITLGNVSGGSFSINPNTTMNGNLTLASGKTITLNATGGKVLSNVYTGTATNSNLTIGESGNTGTLTIYKTIAGTLSVDNIQASTTSASITLFTNSSVSSATITLGNTSGGNLTINPNIVLPANKTITLNSTGGEIKCNSYDCVNAVDDVELFGATLGIAGILPNQTGNNLYIGQSNTSSAWQFGNTNPALDSGTLTINKNVAIASVKSIACLNYNSTSATTTMYIANTSTTGNIVVGDAMTTGILILGNRLSITTGYTLFNHRLRQIRQISSIDRASFWNVAAGSANNIFQSSILSANAMPPVYTAAPTDGWSVWESDTEGEGSFIAQNGNTTIICNPGDNSAFHWQDEDTMGSAAGFKFSVSGVMSTSSDRRLKRDINPIPVGYDLLDKLCLIEYVNYKKKAPTEEKYYRNGKLRQKYQDIHKGLIAQDVKKIFPEVVEKEGEYFMMKYPEVDIYFNIGVQELIKRDKEKQKQIDDLTTRLARLEQILLNP